MKKVFWFMLCSGILIFFLSGNRLRNVFLRVMERSFECDGNFCYIYRGNLMGMCIFVKY